MKTGLLFILLAILALAPLSSVAQSKTTDSKINVGTGKDLPKFVAAPKEVSDEALQDRLTRIFETSGWVPELKVEVREGLVFLSGKVHSEAKKTWAVRIIEQAKGVVGIIDNIEDSRNKAVLSPIQEEVTTIIDRAERITPYALSAIAILAIFGLFSFYGSRFSKRIVGSRTKNTLLASSVGNVVALAIVVLGLYFALRSSGLSTLAVGVLGGTSFIGLGIGLAMKSVFENYSASLMISMREIFKQGEWVKIGDVEGIVQSVTTRGTTLMDFEGNNITIPNSHVTDAVIRNYTRNPNMRTDFAVGISTSESIEKARGLIIQALTSVEGILPEPAPTVLVTDLAPTTIKLKAQFWFNAVTHSRPKMRSSAIQCSLRALRVAKVELETDSREISFLNALPLQRAALQSNRENERDVPEIHDPIPSAESGSNKSEISQLKKQAAATTPAEKGENLLQNN